MWKSIVRTSDSFVDTLLWIALAVVFFPRGAGVLSVDRSLAGGK